MPRARSGAFPFAVAAALVVAAAVTRAPALIVVAAGAVVAWLVVEATGRLALFGVEAEVRLSPTRIVAGERVEAVVVVVNRKPIPMPWIDVRLVLPDGIESAEALPGTPKQYVTAGYAPRGHERVTLRFELLSTQRGAYTLGPLRVRAGDWLGFTSEERTTFEIPEIVVHPAPVAARDRRFAALRPLAETRARRGLLPDPLRFRGVREHRHGDPRKEIHWKASARLRALQTRLYEPASSLDAVFLVNVASYEQFWIQADPEASELVISAAAELIRVAATAGRQVGLITNGIDSITHEPPRAALGRGPKPLHRSLEILARLGPYAASSPEWAFLRERGRLPWGATLIVVTPRIGPGLASACIALHRAQHRVAVLCVMAADEAVSSQLRAAGITVDDLGAARFAAAV
ncbi:MAG TPA: DUF58 domain-containing protein [Candidatus Limnocylindria bacterium]|nr:DUF58 domain-containing protein [Candidatus Limnocylindria bacterium]